MKILGNRVLVSKVEDPKQEGFSTVELQDSFIYKGKVELVGDLAGPITIEGPLSSSKTIPGKFKEGDIIMFARNSPDNQDIEYDGKKLKIINVVDILAIL